MGRVIKILTIGEIIAINRRLIAQFGGIFFDNNQNLLNLGSLEHVLIEIQGLFFGKDLYPSVFQKAAILCYRIIQGHVFYDGNKRTGMEVCRLTLDINGYKMRMGSEIVKMATRIATDDVSFSDFANWVEERCQEV